MSGSSAGPVGVVIVRAWREGPRQQLRMRVTYSMDVSSPRQVVAAASSSEEVCDRVRAWLVEYLRERPRPATRV